MAQKVKDLTVEELENLITETVRDTLRDLLEDLLALSSVEYLNSIKEAREDYHKGRVKEASEVFDV